MKKSSPVLENMHHFETTILQKLNDGILADKVTWCGDKKK